MLNTPKAFAAVTIFLMSFHAANASPLDDLAARVEAFGETTQAGGGGWAAYADFLHEDYSRWSSYQPVYEKDVFIRGLKSWWEAGNRQTDRVLETLDLRVVDKVGIGRFRVAETYVDKDGNQTGLFRGVVSHTWVLTPDGWKLIAIDIFRDSLEQ
ncbi:MAG: DUF4440 domain-containing protein [Pseudomonadota bacterium]